MQRIAFGGIELSRHEPGAVSGSTPAGAAVVFAIPARLMLLRSTLPPSGVPVIRMIPIWLFEVLVWFQVTYWVLSDVLELIGVVGIQSNSRSGVELNA